MTNLGQKNHLKENEQKKHTIQESRGCRCSNKQRTGEKILVKFIFVFLSAFFFLFVFNLQPFRQLIDEALA